MSDFEQPLSDSEQKNLRSRGVISENEIVMKVGDVYVAHNVISSARRPVSLGNVLGENKKLLRD